MSKISNLIGEAKKYKIGEIELEFKPRTLEDIELIMQIAEEGEARAKAMKELIFKTLKEADPEATDEEINQVALTHFKELTEAIIDVNGLQNATTTD